VPESGFDGVWLRTDCLRTDQQWQKSSPPALLEPHSGYFMYTGYDVDVACTGHSSAFEMTCIVSSGALNSTRSLTGHSS